VLQADIDLLESLGAEVMVHFRTEAKVARTEAVAAAAEGAEPGAARLAGGGSRQAPGVARMSPRVPVRVGETVSLAVDGDNLQFFDLDSGRAIAGP